MSFPSKGGGTSGIADALAEAVAEGVADGSAPADGAALGMGPDDARALERKWKGAVAQRVFAAFPQGASPREQVRVTWNEMVAFARENPTAFAFIELHNHGSYLDDESRAVDRNVKDFAEVMVAQAQVQGLVKPLEAKLLMELVFGAFIGMMRAHWEGRITLDESAVARAEAACWDMLALPAEARS